ncbi:MAG: DUF3393 domain-containing protein [Spirochaetes bacterium]|nr:DUF3393 domain-containing protein [Spirochaetota bacterium]
MRKIAPFALFLLSASFVSAQQGGLERIEKKWGDASKLLDDRRFEAERRIDERFNRLSTRLSNAWGKVDRSDKKVFVDYTEDGKGKTKIEFEKGFVAVEVIEDVSREKLLKDDLLKKIKDQLKAAETNVDGTGVQVLKNQIDPAKEKEALAAPQRETYTAPDGTAKVKYTVQVPMVANQMTERAKLYVPLARKCGERYGVPVDLILAVMECESTFNPYADNGIAYGLMQLTPKVGAHDAALSVFGEKQDVPSHKLKNAELNANLGTALLMQYMTWDGWLGKYKAKTYKWEMLAIAGYNAGCGRSVAFASKNPAAMADTDANFFKALHAYMPDETKHYLINVPKARLQYKGL